MVRVAFRAAACWVLWTGRRVRPGRGGGKRPRGNMMEQAWYGPFCNRWQCRFIHQLSLNPCSSTTRAPHAPCWPRRHHRRATTPLGLAQATHSFDDWVAELTISETYFKTGPFRVHSLPHHPWPSLAARSRSRVSRVERGLRVRRRGLSLAILFEEQCLGAACISWAPACRARRSPWLGPRYDLVLRGSSRVRSLYFRRRPNQRLRSRAAAGKSRSNT